MWRSLHWTYHQLAAAGFWIERRFTRAGLLVLGGAVLAGVFGVDTSLTVSYQVFALLGAFLAIAWSATWFGRTPVSVRLRLPHALTAGEPFVLRLAVRNDSARALDGIALRTELADPRPSLAEFRAGLRLPTYRGWVRLTLARRTCRVEEAAAPVLPAHSVTEVELPGRALRRGRLRITGIDCARAEPLGLMRSLERASGPADVCVLPRRYRLPPLALAGARRYQPGGLPQGASMGDSEEFLALRDYRPGDALQRIHWRSYARVGEPVVKEFQDEFVARNALVLDTYAPAGASPRLRREVEEAFEEAVAVAASFAWTLDTHECLLDLMFVGDEVHTYTAGHGHFLPGRLLEVLSAVAPRRDDGLRRLARAVHARAGQLSGCVCVLLGWDEERKTLVDLLRAAGVGVLAYVVSAREPAALPAGVRHLAPGRIAEGLARSR